MALARWRQQRLRGTVATVVMLSEASSWSMGQVSTVYCQLELQTEGKPWRDYIWRHKMDRRQLP